MVDGKYLKSKAGDDGRASTIRLVALKSRDSNGDCSRFMWHDGRTHHKAFGTKTRRRGKTHRCTHARINKHKRRSTHNLSKERNEQKESGVENKSQHIRGRDKKKKKVCFLSLVGDTVRQVERAKTGEEGSLRLQNASDRHSTARNEQLPTQESGKHDEGESLSGARSGGTRKAHLHGSLLEYYG